MLAIVYFLSGSAALSFEVLWFHQAGLAFGNSVWASSLVLAAFMAGLALGNALAASLGDRIPRPIALYAGLELAVAGSGVLLVLALPSLGPVFAPVLRPLFGNPAALNASRLALAFLVLLVPSTAMGMTLPLLVKALRRHAPTFGAALGRLYGWNTLGAVTGVLLAEGVLIAALGIRGTALFAAGTNVLAAVLALRLSRRYEASESGAHRPASNPPSATGAASGRVTLPWLGAAFVCGFILLAMEVVWFRLLVLFVLGSSVSFGVMLATVLAGIGMGGLAAGVWMTRSSETSRLVPALLGLAGAVCLASYTVAPLVTPEPGALLLRTPGEILRIAIPIVAPLSLLSGILFTLIGGGLRAHLQSDASAAGWLTYANTLGAALGALIGGFVLLPTIGMEGSILLLGATYTTTGALLFVVVPASQRYAMGGIALFVLAFATFPSGDTGRHLLAPLARHATGAEERIVAVREGVSQTIVVVEQHWGEQHLSYVMLTDGYSMSGTLEASRRYMGLYVYWPMLVHPGIRDALLISFGIGNTAKALTNTAEIESIDVVDISRDILEMSSIVFDEGSSPLDDARVSVHIEDGRYHLMTTRRRYDLITGEPPPPEVRGVVSLYTREYFQLIHDRLADQGIVTYWLPTHNLSERSSLAILRAFCDVFRDCSLWHGSDQNLMMVGTRGLRGPASLDRFTRQWTVPRVAEDMRFVGFERPEQMGALFIGDAVYLDEITADVPPLTDDRPRRIARQGPSGETPLYEAWLTSEGTEERWRESEYIASIWPRAMIEASEPMFPLQRTITVLERPGVPLEVAHEAAHYVLTETPFAYPLAKVWGVGSNGFRAAAALEGRDVGPREAYLLGVDRLGRRDFAGAADSFQRAEADPLWGALALGYRVYALCLIGDDEAVDELAASIAGVRAALPAREWFWDFLRQTVGCAAVPA